MRGTLNTGGSHREQSMQDGRGGESWPSPRSSNRPLSGYTNAHDLLMSAGGSSVLGNLGLPFSLGHLATQLTQQQLSSLAPHLSALASQQQITAQQISSLSPQHQELLALHAVKQQQQQLHLQQREQIANLQNSLRNAPNRLATLNLNLSGLGNLSNLGGLGLGNLAGLSGLGDRNMENVALGSSLNGLPIRKMGLGNTSNFSSGLSSISSSGTSGGNSLHPHENSTPSFAHPSLPSNSSFSPNGTTPHEQSATPLGADDGSWLDFLSLPAGRIDPLTLPGLGPLSGLALGGLVDRDRNRESAVRGSGGQSDASSSLFGLQLSGSDSGSNLPSAGNAAYGSGVASGGGYGLGVGLGHDGLERHGTPIERSSSRAESMEVDKESTRSEREQNRRGRSAEGERDEESQLRKRPRWE